MWCSDLYRSIKVPNVESSLHRCWPIVWSFASLCNAEVGLDCLICGYYPPSWITAELFIPYFWGSGTITFFLTLKTFYSSSPLTLLTLSFAREDAYNNCFFDFGLLSKKAVVYVLRPRYSLRWKMVGAAGCIVFFSRYYSWLSWSWVSEVKLEWRSPESSEKSLPLR